MLELQVIEIEEVVQSNLTLFQHLQKILTRIDDPETYEKCRIISGWLDSFLKLLKRIDSLQFKGGFQSAAELIMSHLSPLKHNHPRYLKFLQASCLLKNE